MLICNRKLKTHNGQSEDTVNIMDIFHILRTWGFLLLHKPGYSFTTSKFLQKLKSILSPLKCALRGFVSTDSHIIMANKKNVFGLFD